jgi:peptidoglycan/LPS O-acetylase OafA/YrhL
MIILNVHYAVGLILFVTALAGIFNATARRAVVYVLLLQLLLGAATWGITKLMPPPQHWILAILAGGIWPLANAFEKRGRPKGVVMGVAAVGAIVVAYVIYVGMHALRGQTPLT